MKKDKIVTKLDAPTTMDFGSGSTPFAFMSSASWAMTDQDSSTSLSNQVTTDNDGEFIPASIKTYGEKTDITANYESKVNTSITLGAISVGGAGAVAVDSISITTAQGAKAKASVKGHSHGSGTHMARARSVSIPSFLGWGANAFGFDIGVDSSCIQTATYDVAFGHKDQPNNDGDQLLGITHSETHTLKVDYVSDTAPSDIEGWTMTNYPDDGKLSRDGFISGSVSYVKYVGAPA